MSIKFILASCFTVMTFSACATSTVPEIYLKKSDMKMELHQEAYGIEALALSRDGKYLFTSDSGKWSLSGGFGSGRSSLRFWDLTGGRQISRLKAEDTITSVALSNDNAYAVTGGFMGGQGSFPALQLWDLDSGRIYKTRRGGGDFDGNEFGSVRFSKDGRYFLATDWMSVKIFDAVTGDLIKLLRPEGFSRPPSQIPYKSMVAAFSPDGKYVLGGGHDGVVRLWDVGTGRELKQLYTHKTGSFMSSGGISTVEFSHDGKHAITNAYNDGTVILWDIEKGVETRRFTGFDSLFGIYFLGRSLSFSPDDARLLVVGDRILDVPTGKTLVDLMYVWKGIQMVGRNPVSGEYHPDGRHVLMTMNDAAVRIYDATTGEEVAVLIGFEDGEWLAITTEGYYNASEKGAQYLSVNIDDKSYSVDSFYDVFYRPDIVAAKLRGDDIQNLVTITMRDAVRNPPPVVEFTAPPQDPGQLSVKVCYEVKSTGGGIGEVRLFHNGKLIQSDGYYRDMAWSGADRQLVAMNSAAIYENMRGVAVKGRITDVPSASRSKGDEFKDCQEIEAVSGENEVSVAAFNSNNTVQSIMRTITFRSSQRSLEPHLYILSIGVDRYKDRNISLAYAAKDASDIEQKLLNQSATVYQPQNVHHELLTDSKAGKAGILGRIDELSRKIRPGDGFILFVAGHGVLIQNQYYVLTSDFDGTVSDSSMISSNEIVEMSKKIRSLSQLFIFDTCHAGGVDAIVSGLYDARMSVLAKKMGLHVYASANSLQEAKDGYQGNGLFTYTLLDGLGNKREADRNKDNAVSLTELGEYSRDATAEISKKIGHSQTPLIINFGKDGPVYNLR